MMIGKLARLVNLTWWPIVIIASILSNIVSFLVSSQVSTVSDTVGLQDTLATAPDSARSAPRRPDRQWNAEYSFLAGFASVDFPERSEFVSNLSNDASTKKWTVDQPFGASDIGPRAGFEMALRRKEVVRLAAGGWYQGWSAQAIARDTTGGLNHRSYGCDLLVGAIGADLLVSKQILRLDAGRDAFVGGRVLIGAGRLEGRKAAWGTATGFTLAAGAEFLDWRKWAVAGQLGLDWLSLQSSSPWSDVLWNSSNNNKVSWNGGGLSLTLALRWGSPHDSIPGQKSTKPKPSTPTNPTNPVASPKIDTSKMVTKPGSVPATKP
jgi:hypothetical protein